MPQPSRVQANRAWAATEQDRSVSLSQAAREVGPVLYAVRVGEMIKIGFTRSLHSRMKKYGSFQNLLALKPGTLADENALHASLREHRARGREYYHPAPEVLTVVNEWRTALNFEPVAA